VNFIIAGASAGLGRSLATELAGGGHGLLLIAGDERDLRAQAMDLKIRFGTVVEVLACRIQSDEQSIDRVEEHAQKLGEIDGIFFPLCLSKDSDDGLSTVGETNLLIDSNLSGTIALTGRFLPGMLRRNKGYLVGFGSVASERGRGSNIVYAAAKRGLSSFFESIRHKVAGTGIKVHFYQMGYMKTSQTFGKKLPFPAASPRQAAQQVVANLDRDRGTVYYPGFWRWICFCLRMTPWMLYKKLRF
jgi:short-subunit dehydrogenase